MRNAEENGVSTGHGWQRQLHHAQRLPSVRARLDTAAADHPVRTLTYLNPQIAPRIVSFCLPDRSVPLLYSAQFVWALLFCVVMA
jgi:hypothetical protein